MLQITIIGMGLIGTSLGLALRQADPATSRLGALAVTGYDADHRATNAARGRLAIDRVARSLPDAVQQAQVVVLATPVRTMRDLLTELAPLLSQDTVVTDVASTKGAVCGWAAELLPSHAHFVGGHPMAGSERSGPEAAFPELFRDALYCLTATPAVPPAALELIERLVQAIGARPYYIDPVEHDAYVAGISHLPFVLSTILVDVVSQGPGWNEMTALAASGFRDVSRLASGDPAMHRDICLTNRDALIRWLDATIAMLDEMRTLLEYERADEINTLFVRAQQTRDAWLANRPGLRPGEAQFQEMPSVERRRLFTFGNPFGRKDRNREDQE